MRLFREKLLGKLLCYGGATSCAFLSHDTSFEHSSSQRIEIYAGMAVESLVFRGNECMYEMWRQGVVIYSHPVCFVLIPCPYQFPVGRIYLRGIFVNRILKLIHIRHVSNPSVPDAYKEHGD